MEWSNISTIKLIEAYRQAPVLWDSGHIFFRSSNRKEMAWEELAVKFKTNSFEIKKKINSLLSSFRRERRKIDLHLAGIGEEHCPKWFAFKSMRFLLQKLKTKKEHLSAEDVKHVELEGYKIHEDIENETDSTEGSQPEDPLQPEISLATKETTCDEMPVKRVKTDDDPHAQADFLKEPPEKFEDRDDCVVYGEHVALKLRSYDYRTRAVVQHKISNILFEADMGHFQ